jgi:hypothetical protein
VFRFAVLALAVNALTRTIYVTHYAIRRRARHQY